jgi:serine/threonine-protein kinase
MKTCAVCKRSWEDDFRLCPIDGTPLQSVPGAADINVGRTIGHCRVVEKVADGDLGPIYKAEDPIRGAVALQLVPAGRITSPILGEAFQEAVNLATRLNHPNVIRVFGMETAPDASIAVVMEYVSGTDLQSYRRSRPGMDAAEACALVKQVCEGVVAAHRMSMLHGALHPGRIMVAADGAVKVGGFHRSGLREGVDIFSAKEQNVPYLAPEQLGIVRDVAAPDYRADVYAIGVILYELLASRLPREARSVQELASQLEGAPPLPPNFANPAVSPLLSRVVQKAVSKHPSERQGSVEELLRELEATRQAVREPQRASVSAPEYPPPAADSGLFAPPAQGTRDSSLFAPPARDSAASLWPEAAQEKPASGEGSFFGWFKTRVDRPGPRRPEPRASRSWDDSTGGAAPGSSGDEEITERTVMVSGARKSRSRKHGFADTFTSFGWRRDQDMTGTGALPSRKISSRAWIIAACALVMAVVLAVALYLLFFSTPQGSLVVLTTPPGAVVSICPEPCQDLAFRPLTDPKLRAGFYRLRVQMEGYETKEDRIEVVENDDRPHYYDLVSKLPPPPPIPVSVPEPQPETPVSTPAPEPPKPSLTTPFYNALRLQNYFPETPGNAWDILQRWQQIEAGTPSPGLEEALQRFCRSVEDAGQQKLFQKDFAGARQLLDQLRTRMPGQSCAAGLQSSYEKAVSNDKANLMISTQGAMDRHHYVTPESENALKYVRHIESIDPNDSDARRLELEIFNRAWEQAGNAASKRQHQDALDIYNQLRSKYPAPPVGVPALLEAIQKQTLKQDQFQALKPSFSVQVRHGHGRGLAFWRTRECSGSLRVDGFSLEYKSADENEHSFQISYDALKDAKFSGATLTLVHPAIRPEGRIELEQSQKTAGPGLDQVYRKITEYRNKYAEYIR